MRKSILSVALLVSFMPQHLQAQEAEARLLRFPAIHGQTIVFTYAGNLYTVAASGGVARKLTNHDGFEMSTPLYYYNWVQGNIQKVADATKGKVGYIHVPDMLATGLNEFVKHFYPQLRKKALIIDVRGNGGGNVSPQLIERLRREIALVDVARNIAITPDPYDMLYGPMVCLMNEFSASDGDLFPYRFKHHKLGKLIGKRSWGGVIGIRGTLPLLDGGYLNKPEFGTYSVDGKWVIEGYGVDPDIVIDNDPAREFAGTDDQLNRAIAVIVEELRQHERTLPPLPPWPKR